LDEKVAKFPILGLGGVGGDGWGEGRVGLINSRGWGRGKRKGEKRLQAAAWKKRQSQITYRCSVGKSNVAIIQTQNSKLAKKEVDPPQKKKKKPKKKKKKKKKEGKA